MNKEQDKIYTEQDMLDYMEYVSFINMRYHFKVPLSPSRWYKEVKNTEPSSWQLQRQFLYLGINN